MTTWLSMNVLALCSPVTLIYTSYVTIGANIYRKNDLDWQIKSSSGRTPEMLCKSLDSSSSLKGPWMSWFFSSSPPSLMYTEHAPVVCQKHWLLWAKRHLVARLLGLPIWTYLLPLSCLSHGKRDCVALLVATGPPPKDNSWSGHAVLLTSFYWN